MFPLAGAVTSAAFALAGHSSGRAGSSGGGGSSSSSSSRAVGSRGPAGAPGACVRARGGGCPRGTTTTNGRRFGKGESAVVPNDWNVSMAYRRRLSAEPLATVGAQGEGGSSGVLRMD
jgi:hypothetical protein